MIQEDTLRPSTQTLRFQKGLADIGTDPREDDTSDPPELVICPATGWIGINWREMIASREILLFLIRRDILLRYKQTVLGGAWAILQPLMLMGIFTFVFGRYAKVDARGFPYPVFVFAGLIPWSLFSQGMPQAALSLVSQQHLLTKVYFPRLFVPIAAASVFLVDLLLSLGIYAVVLAYYGIVPRWTTIFLPVLILLTLMGTLAFGVMIAALTVFYRDFKHIVPFMMQLFMFVTPVFYSTSVFTERTRLFLSLNPIFGIINAYRSAILGVDWDLTSLAISTASTVLLFTFSLFYFRRTERRFADFA
jgi:lipopolysaccharide transport system permease protein